MTRQPLSHTSRAENGKATRFMLPLLVGLSLLGWPFAHTFWPLLTVALGGCLVLRTQWP